MTSPRLTRSVPDRACCTGKYHRERKQTSSNEGDMEANPSQELRWLFRRRDRAGSEEEERRRRES